MPKATDAAVCIIESVDGMVSIKTWGSLNEEAWANVLLQCMMELVGGGPSVDKAEVDEILKKIGGYKDAR